MAVAVGGNKRLHMGGGRGEGDRYRQARTFLVKLGELSRKSTASPNLATKCQSVSGQTRIRTTSEHLLLSSFVPAGRRPDRNRGGGEDHQG